MNLELDQKICSYLETHKKDFIKDLQSLVSIASYKEAAASGAPFGSGPLRCLKAALSISEAAGLAVRNVDGYCGYAQWGEGKNHVASLSHLDTVPIGDGWIHDPLGGTVENGIMYGRGTSDDKGGAIASLYAVKALMASGFIPKLPIRLIYGCDEECGMGDMPYYLQHEPAPVFAFSPDAGFPLFYAEKGRIEGRVCCTLSGETSLISIEGGTAANVVPALAEAVLKGLHASELPASDFIHFREENDLVRVSAEGISCHGGAPHGGRNAACLLMDYLARILPDSDAAKAPLVRFAAMIGMHLDGKGLGIDCADEISGLLTMNIGVVKGDSERIWFIFDVRHPVTLDVDATAEKLACLFSENGWSLSSSSVSHPLYVPTNSPLVRTLMGVYRDITGDMTPPATMGGGTYARTLPCAVSFGHTFAGDNSRGHTYEENVNLDHLIQASRIYAHAFAQLSYLHT